MPLPMHKESTEKNSSKITHCIAVAAGKGGVGKSTIAVNLALILRKLGYFVGLMDTDIYGPSVRKMLPEDRMPTQKGDLLYPALCQGIRMMSMAYFRRENESAAVRAPIVNSIVSQFIHNVVWGELDYLLIDFPPGTGDIQLTLTQQANLDGAVMVSTPQEIATMDVRKAMHMFTQVNVPIIGVIENMSGFYHEAIGEEIFIFGKGGGEKLAREIGVPFLGSVPVDPEISFRSDLGKTIFDDNETKCRSAQPFLQIGEKVHVHCEALKRGNTGCLHSFELKWEELPE